MARKKWGPGNALYDWQHRKTMRSSRRARSKSKGGIMARRRGRSSRGGGLMSGRAIFPVGGLLGSAMLGVGVAALAKRFLGAPLGAFTGAALGFAVGGVGGAAGGYLHDNIGNVGGATSGAGQTVY